MFHHLSRNPIAVEAGAQSPVKPRRLRRLVQLVILPAMACGILTLSPSTANAAVDPGGSGASATTAILCNNRTHQLTIRSRTYYGDQTILRRIMWAVPGGQWVNFVVDGQYWTSPGNTDYIVNMSSVAPLSVVFTIEYAFQPPWVTTYWNYAWERPSLYQWFASGGYRTYSTCNL